jgi:hypothetical protein
MSVTLAPHVEFDADKHEYWYEGRQLSGVTGLISKKLGLKMPQEFVEEHRLEGIHVHKAVQKWIETGDPESVHSGVRWLMESWDKESLPGAWAVHSEVLVSDFKHYASAVDIVQEMTGSSLAIYDLKKGSMNRKYVTYQLNIYRYFIEQYAKRKVCAMVCISLRDRNYYDVFRINDAKIEELLYGKDQK